MNIFKLFKKPPKAWEHLLTTYSVDLNSTNLLFADNHGNFEKIQLQGVPEIPFDTHLKHMKDHGLTNLIFYRDGKKYVLLEYPDQQPQNETLPIRPPRKNEGQQTSGTTNPA